jgi:hypothetical protein
MSEAKGVIVVTSSGFLVALFLNCIGSKLEKFSQRKWFQAVAI